MEYLELDIRKERFCAYPISGVPSGIWKWFPVRGGTWLRKILYCLSCLMVIRFFFKRTNQPLRGCGCRIEDLDAVLQELFPNRGVSCAFAWPAPSRSTGRFYAYAFAKDGEFVAYVKLATSPQDDIALAQELSALKSLLTRKDLPFSTPSVLASGKLSGQTSYVVFTPLPITCDAVRWSSRSWDEDLGRLHDAFASGTQRRLSVMEVVASDWACEFRKRATAEDYALLLRVCQRGVEVSANHGDMALHNIRRAKGRWWLFDWETYSDASPLLVDELTVYVCTRYFIEKWSCETLLTQMKTDYPVSKAETVVRVMQACAFVYAYNLSFANEFLLIFREYGRAV